MSILFLKKIISYEEIHVVFFKFEFSADLRNAKKIPILRS